MMKRVSALLLTLTLLATMAAFAQTPVPGKLGVRVIESEAFSGDRALTSYTFEEDVSYIGSRAFKDCTALETVYCFTRDAVIEDDAFEGVTGATVYCEVNSTMDAYAHSKGYTVKYLNAFETECDTDENGCILLPITWNVVNPMPGRDIASTYVYEVYMEGQSAPVYTSGSTSSTEFTWTPTVDGDYYVDITMTNELTTTKLASKKVKVKDKLYMGTFEQDGNSATADKIQWQVLAVSGNKALVITTKILKNESYFNPYWIKYKYTYWSGSYIGTASSVNYRGSGPESAATKITGISPTHIPLADGSWGKESDLFRLHARYWCNNTFYNSAFTSKEKSRILLTNNANPNSPSGVAGGPNTSDHVFFLSYNELMQYMPTAASRKCGMTTVAAQKKNNNTGNFWWLRTPGKVRCNAMYVYGTSGTLSQSGSDVGHNGVGYRPCRWSSIGCEVKAASQGSGAGSAGFAAFGSDDWQSRFRSAAFRPP